MQNSVLFLYTNNELSEKKKMKQFCSNKVIAILRNKFTKGDKDLCPETRRH